jgi:hypothetical protein
MYEIGKRDLPIGATTKLVEIILFLEQKQKIPKEEKELLKKQQVKVQEIIKRESKELEYKQIKEQRILDKIQKKHNQSVQIHSLAEHLQKIRLEFKKFLLENRKESYGVVALLEKN